MSEKVINKISVANPTGLGLFGLAMVTFVAASQKLGITTGLSFVIVYAMFLGATAQLIASILDFLHENIWGATVFGAYAFFWYAVGTCWLMNMGALGPVLKGAVDIKQLGFAFLGYLIFSIFMTIGRADPERVRRRSPHHPHDRRDRRNGHCADFVLRLLCCSAQHPLRQTVHADGQAVRHLQISALS